MLALDKDEAPRSFPNCYIDTYSYSGDNKFLTFFSNVKNKQGTLNVLALDKDEAPRSFPNCNRDPFLESKYDHPYRYSGDNKFLTFFSNVKDKQGTLQVLALDKNEAPRSFPNCYLLNYHYSSDSKFLSFLADVNDYEGTLNVLELNQNQVPLSFPKTHINDYIFSADSKFLTFCNWVNFADHLNVIDLEQQQVFRSFRYVYPLNYRYSSDNKFLTFFTNVNIDGQGTLQVLALDKNEPPRSFPNSYSYEDRETYRYSSDNKFLTFFTNVKGNQGTLNLLPLVKSTSNDLNDFQDVRISFDINERKTFEYRNYTSFYSFSPDSRLLLFENGSRQQLSIWDVYANQYIGKYCSSDIIKQYALSKDNRWLFLTTKNDVLKIIDLSIPPSQRRAHYDKILQFTPEEKERYGIE